MKAKKEIREEREDVVSFWVEKKVLNSNDEIEVIEEKVDECTVVDLQNRIDAHKLAIADLEAKIQVENSKIQLANDLLG